MASKNELLNHVNYLFDLAIQWKGAQPEEEREEFEEYCRIAMNRLKDYILNSNIESYSFKLLEERIKKLEKEK